MSEFAKILLGIIGFILACVVGIWAFTYYPTIAWIVFVTLLIGVAGTITGLFPGIYRKIKGIK